jgi:hypothetical protein
MNQAQDSVATGYRSLNWLNLLRVAQSESAFISVVVLPVAEGTSGNLICIIALLLLAVFQLLEYQAANMGMWRFLIIHSQLTSPHRGYLFWLSR